MSKRSSLVGVVLAALLMVMLLVMSFSVTMAQDAATPVPLPTATDIPAVELGTGGTHISFWNGLTGSDGVTLIDMLQPFQQAHPEISVTIEQIPWNTLYTKLQAAFVAGQPPDVIILHASEIPQFASYGVLKDLSGWYTDKGGWFPIDDISDITRNGMMYDGVTYGIPLDNHGRGLWINKGAFVKAGLDPNMDPPVGYDAWVSLFQKLTLDKNGKNAADPAFDPTNVVQWGYTVGEWPRVNFLAALVQNGGSFASEDGKTITVNSEAGVKALQQEIDLVYKYHVSPPEAGFDTWQGFGAGTVAILPTGSWFRNQAATFSDIDSAPWSAPQFGEKNATWFGAHTWMVPDSEEGDKLAAVETLIHWVSDNQKGWAASGQVPARLSVQKELDPENYPSNILYGKGFSEYGVLDFQSTAIQEMYAALDPELSAALNNQKTAKQALDDAASRMQQALDRANAGS
jgi:ABC-type glycerol-3-phosphate transport system substrate-binding protein